MDSVLVVVSFRKVTQFITIFTCVVIEKLFMLPIYFIFLGLYYETFKNYRSFRNEVTLGMEAAPILGLSNAFVRSCDEELLSVAVMYGARGESDARFTWPKDTGHTWRLMC